MKKESPNHRRGRLIVPTPDVSGRPGGIRSDTSAVGCDESPPYTGFMPPLFSPQSHNRIHPRRPLRRIETKHNAHDSRHPKSNQYRRWVYHKRIVIRA